MLLRRLAVANHATRHADGEAAGVLGDRRSPSLLAGAGAGDHGGVQ